MKRHLIVILLLLFIFSGCSASSPDADIAATTQAVYEFTQLLCQGTDLTVAQLVTESVSCLHDYTLQVSQMRIIENADLVIMNGAGLETFLDDALTGAQRLVDSSEGIELICPGDGHDHDHGHDHEHDHSHDADSHTWLSPENAAIMAGNICRGLCEAYPEYTDDFNSNLDGLLSRLEQLQRYGEEALSGLSCREIITFHDGFAYFARSFDLTILEAVEEESGSEASAQELIHLIELVQEHSLPAIFTEVNGSSSAASVISAETGAAIYTLDMAMASENYFDAMYHNINTIKEALE